MNVRSLDPGLQAGETPMARAETPKVKIHPISWRADEGWSVVSADGDWLGSHANQARESSDGPRISNAEPDKKLPRCWLRWQEKINNLHRIRDLRSRCGLARHVPIMAWVDQFLLSKPHLVLTGGSEEGRTWWFLIPCAVCHHGPWKRNREQQSELNRIFGGRQCDGSMYGASKEKIMIIHFHIQQSG